MRIISMLLWLLALVAQPVVAASSPQLDSVERQVAALVAGKSGEFGIAAYDLISGESISINGDELFPMASTVKLAVAAAYLTQVDHGRRSLSEMIGNRTAAQQMEAMLIRSDNEATDALIRNLGGTRTVQRWLEWNGLSGIRIDRTIAQLLSDPRDLRDSRDSSSPRAMIALLKEIDGGTSLKPESRSYLLSLMGRCITGRNRIRGLLPASARVEHKTGTLSGLTGDVGFITLPNGRRIAVAFFARGGSDRPRTIAEAARAIYDGFAGSWQFALTHSYPAPTAAAN